jgi:TonB family protein
MRTRLLSSWPVLLLACVLGLTTIAAHGHDNLQSENISRKHSQRVKAKAAALGFVLDYDQPPTPVKIAAARYPRDAEQRHTQDIVVVMLAIDARGRVPDAEVLEGVGALHEAALACVKEWRFKPAQKRGLPVGTVMLAPVMFLTTPSV